MCRRFLNSLAKCGGGGGCGWFNEREALVLAQRSFSFVLAIKMASIHEDWGLYTYTHTHTSTHPRQTE